MGDSCLVLFSGGQDSTTCLFWAKRQFASVSALAFDYGQKHSVELDQAALIADKAEVTLDVMPARGVLSGSALTEHDKEISAEHERNCELPASFVPARNAMFLTLAAGFAYNREIFDLVGGMCQTDYSGYPDCRRTCWISCVRCLTRTTTATVRTTMNGDMANSITLPQS